MTCAGFDGRSTFYHLAPCHAMTRALLLAALAASLAACGTSSSTPRDGDLERDGNEAAQNELRRFPGVSVTETSRGIQVRLRGTTSFMGDQEPLYIVDNIRTEPGSDGTLAGLRQADIADIRVLKSAAETSAYGPRGANGVVIITTTTAIE